MAGGRDLSRRTRRRLLALLAVVLVGHGVALHWLSRWQAEAASLLRPLATPMYTRVLQPQEPVAPPPRAEAPPAPAAAAPPPRNRIRAAPSVPRTSPAKPAAPPAEARAPEPAAEVAKQAEPAETGVASGEGSDPSTPPAQPGATPSAAEGTGTPAATPPQDSWPADTRLRYRLGGRFRSGDLYGNARVLWQRESGRYQVRVEVDVTFMASLSMTSQGEVGPEGLMPRIYEELNNGRQRGLRIGEREVMLGNGSVVARPAGLQDTASQFVDLTHRFASGREKLEVGRAVSFWMARPGAVDLWTYDIVGSEVLRTPLGDIEAFHLKPRPLANPRGNITAEMWYAPALQYLPVRIRVNMGDEAHIDLLVEAIEQR
jgi:hypothetical protein